MKKGSSRRERGSARAGTGARSSGVRGSVKGIFRSKSGDKEDLQGKESGDKDDENVQDQEDAEQDTRAAGAVSFDEDEGSDDGGSEGGGETGDDAEADGEEVAEPGDKEGKSRMRFRSLKGKQEGMDLAGIFKRNKVRKPARYGRGGGAGSGDASVNDSTIQTKERPSYKLKTVEIEHDDVISEGEEDESEYDGGTHGGTHSAQKAKHIESSAGTHRLNRILSRQSGAAGVAVLGAGSTLQDQDDNDVSPFFDNLFDGAGGMGRRQLERVSDPQNMNQVARFVGGVVLPPLKVDLSSIGGKLVLETGYPNDTMQQEVILVVPCQSFESTGDEAVTLSALQYPTDYTKHKRSLGLFAAGGTSKSFRTSKLRYVILARSTTRPLVDPPIRKQSSKVQQQKQQQKQQKASRDESERGDYDTMFGPGGESSFIGDESISRDLSLDSDDSPSAQTPTKSSKPGGKQDTGKGNESSPKVVIDLDEMGTSEEKEVKAAVDDEEEEDDADLGEEIASFPVLVCMTLNSDGTAPDIRKLIPLQNLTTIQDLHSTVVQLAFGNGDTIRLDFGHGDTKDESKAIEGTLDKERFIWSLIQVHSMLCLSVVERTSMAASGNNKDRMLLPPLNVRNLDRAELQYVATVNGFLSRSKTLIALIDRQRALMEGEEQENRQLLRQEDRSEKMEMEERDNLAFDLMMGNISMRVSLFTSEDERKDAEEILNSTEWTSSLQNEENAAASVAERLGEMLQMRMRDLEAETCRRLIAWEDEKHYSVTGEAKLHTNTDERDTVDALALASLFKTLEALDTELQGMEDWLQERAAAIKPLTDDCADIEEENRQLEQQWKSYDMLGAEMKRLLKGMEIPDSVEKILKNPASALVYDDDGHVDVDESEAGVEEIYQAGRSLQDAIDFPLKSGGLHLDAVSERAEGLNTIANSFCTALAHIIVTVMEQFNQEVLAGSDYGKVSKNDTHSMIAKKIRDTQRKFQSALLGYIKLIEILAALNPDMLPALRDAYSEMVSESILMKKRMKGYFQALPGKNAAYMNKAGKDLKDYVSFSDDQVLELVNAPDCRAALSELLPVIAREAYFTSALFGAAAKEQDGREKKRNFESTRKAVDNASQHFRYYIERTCGILPDQIGGRSTIDGGVKGDPLLCLVGSICLNEVMDNYIDREKKGGDHSLSLAHVRATILDLRKKADKQWVGWVDKQVEWIKSHDGVPLSGKRAGIFASFARFPCYLDHLMLACSEGREEGYEPDLTHIKVVSHYLQRMAEKLLDSLKECASRETTDQQYAANVMRMENTYFFTQSIKRRNNVFVKLFEKQINKANDICKSSTDAYLGWMIKREFTALHELFSSVSKLRREVGDSQVPAHVPKKEFVRTLQREANRDTMKEKITVMFSRMEKHLSVGGGLLPVAWKALVKVLYEWFGRWEKMCTQIYGHTLNPSAVDIVRIAKAAGGAARPKQGSTNDFGFKSILALGNKHQQETQPNEEDLAA